MNVFVFKLYLSNSDSKKKKKINETCLKVATKVLRIKKERLEVKWC